MSEKRSEYDQEIGNIMDEYKASKEESSTSDASVATDAEPTKKPAEEAGHAEETTEEADDKKPQEKDSETGEEATESTGEEPAKEKSKATGGINKKMKQLTKQRRQAERETREANKRYADLEARLRKFEEAQVQPEKKKGIEDFETLTDYQRHLAKEEALKVTNDYKQQASKEAASEQEVRKLSEVFKSNVEKARAIAPDYDEVMEDFPTTLPLTPEVQRHLAGSPAGPLTMYHMTCNEQVVNALNNAATPKEVNEIVAYVHNNIRRELNSARQQTASTETTEPPAAQGAVTLTPPKGKSVTSPPKQGKTGNLSGDLEDLEGDEFLKEFRKAIH